MELQKNNSSSQLNGFGTIKTAYVPRHYNVKCRCSSRPRLRSYRKEVKLTKFYLVEQDIREISITHCRLTSKQRNLFQCLPSLKSIDLQFNQLELFDFGIMKQNLKEVHVSGNRSKLAHYRIGAQFVNGLTC